MKFLLDETVSTLIPLLKDLLRENGHDVTSMSNIVPGTDDRSVLQLAALEGRTIITHDSDFSEYRFRDNLHMPYGVVFIEDSKHQVNRYDTLFTRKIGSAIEYIVAQVVDGEYNLYDTIFTLTQPTPYGPMKMRPKREKHKKEIVTGMWYVEEQLEAKDHTVMTSTPVEHLDN